MSEERELHWIGRLLEVASEVGQLTGQLEITLTDAVARTVPWCSPLPTAYLTARATVRHLSWPNAMGLVAGLIIEGLGLASVATALELREYNATRRKYPAEWTAEQRRKSKMKVDPPAPFALAVVLVGLYFVSVTALTVALDTTPRLAVYAPLLFPLLSLGGVTVLALRANHRRRLGGLAQRDAPSKCPTSAQESAQGRRTARAQGVHSEAARVEHVTAQQSAQNGVLDAVNRTRRERKAQLMDALLDAYQGDPSLGATEAARKLGVHRNTIYAYTAELEAAGRLHRNGDGVKVLG